MTNPFAGKKPVQLELLVDDAEDMTKAERDEAMIETLLQDESYAGIGVDGIIMIDGKATLIDHKFSEPTPEPKPTAWQRVFGIVFGNEVAHLPARPFNSDERVSKRRLRRLRGKAKEARRAA